MGFAFVLCLVALATAYPEDEIERFRRDAYSGAGATAMSSAKAGATAETGAGAGTTTGAVADSFSSAGANAVTGVNPYAIPFYRPGFHPYNYPMFGYNYPYRHQYKNFYHPYWYNQMREEPYYQPEINYNVIEHRHVQDINHHHYSHMAPETRYMDWPYPMYANRPFPTTKYHHMYGYDNDFGFGGYGYFNKYTDYPMSYRHGYGHFNKYMDYPGMGYGRTRDFEYGGPYHYFF